MVLVLVFGDVDGAVDCGVDKGVDVVDHTLMLLLFVFCCECCVVFAFGP